MSKQASQRLYKVCPFMPSGDIYNIWNSSDKTESKVTESLRDSRSHAGKPPSIT
jgi:hypothetical protein